MLAAKVKSFELIPAQRVPEFSFGFRYLVT